MPSSSGDDNDLWTIVYVSERCPEFFPTQAHMDELVRFAAASNIRIGMSGYLLVSGPYFLQRLEGQKGPLMELFAGISRDERHRQVVLVEQRPIEARRYGQWSMKTFDLQVGGVNGAMPMLRALSATVLASVQCVDRPVLRAILTATPPPARTSPQTTVLTVAVGPHLCGPVGGRLVVDNPIFRRLHFGLRRRLTVLAQTVSVRSVGLVLQYVMEHPLSGVSHSFLNKVVRAACEAVEAIEGTEDLPDARIAVTSGVVEALVPDASHRRMRLLTGKALDDGWRIATHLHQTMTAVAVESECASHLLVEFETESATVAGLRCEMVVERYIPSFPALTPTPKITGRTAGEGLLQTSDGALFCLTGSQLDAMAADIDDAASVESQVLVNHAHADLLNIPLKGIKKGGFGMPDVPDPNPTAEDVAAWAATLARDDPLASDRSAPVASGTSLGPDGQPLAPDSQAGGPSNVSEAMGSDGRLFQIIYCSEMREVMSDEALAALKKSTEEYNAARGITGTLIVVRPFFLHFLEGPTKAVRHAFANRVRTDRRQKSVRVIWTGTVDTSLRRMATWNMFDLDKGEYQQADAGPTRDTMRIITTQVEGLSTWLPVLYRDLLLRGSAPKADAFAQALRVSMAIEVPPGDVSEFVQNVVRLVEKAVLGGGEVIGVWSGVMYLSGFASLREDFFVAATVVSHELGVRVGLAVGPCVITNTSLSDRSLNERQFPDLVTMSASDALAVDCLEMARGCGELVVADATAAPSGTVAHVTVVPHPHSDDFVIAKVELKDGVEAVPLPPGAAVRTMPGPAGFGDTGLVPPLRSRGGRGGGAPAGAQPAAGVTTSGSTIGSRVSADSKGSKKRRGKKRK